MIFQQRFSIINCIMLKVKAYLFDFYESLLPQSHSYKKFVKKNFSYSLKYLLILIFILNAFFVSTLVVRLNPTRVNNLLNSLKTNLSQYPPNLIINIRNGTLLSNYNRPYFMWLDYLGKKYLFVAVDENAMPQKIKQYNASILLTAKNLVVQNISDSAHPTIIPLTQLNDQVIDSQIVSTINMYLEKIIKIYPLFFWAIVISLLLLLPILSFTLNFIHLLLASFIIFITFKYFQVIRIGKHLRFAQTLQLSFHAITLPLVLDYSLTMIHLKNKPSPLLFFCLVLVFIFAAVYETYHSESRLKTTKHN